MSVRDKKDWIDEKLEKRDWINEHYNGNWEMFVDPVELYDAIHAIRPGRIADSLRAMISGFFDAEGNVTDAIGLAGELRALADSLGAR